jgi:hypothetical protein
MNLAWTNQMAVESSIPKWCSVGIASSRRRNPERSPPIPIPDQRTAAVLTDKSQFFESSSIEEEEQKQRETWFDYCDYVVFRRVVDRLVEQRSHFRSNYALSVNLKCLENVIRARQNNLSAVNRATSNGADLDLANEELSDSEASTESCLDDLLFDLEL